MFRGSRPLKRWRYVAVFDEQFMACAAQIQLGPARQSFWAVLSRRDGRLRERTRTLLRRGVVELQPGRLWISDGGVLLDLGLEEDEGIQALCPHGGEHVWTRKQAGIPARGTLTLDEGPPRQLEALAVIDDTAGYHARFTEWWWSAGVGAGPDGTALAWNLVAGVNDPPTGSERAVWVAGEPSETAPVTFAPDLGSILAEDGSRLRFAPEAERRRRENLLVVRSDYRAPFGIFSGTLPGHVELAHGLGVVEHHRAHW
ncbi:MAG TPA: DUF2804 family protein [Solirubrobacteraceae bacterium]|nr:DUF2804 family protein [Solirubrobacteraceae bacterium]